MDDQQKKYDLYSSEDFLQDDFFILSVTNPKKESDDFWEEKISTETINVREYEMARHFIDSVQVQPEPVTQAEKHALWEDIEVANKGYLKKRKNRYRLYFSAVAGVAASFALFLVWNGLPNNRHTLSPKEEIAYHIEDVKAPQTSITDIQLVVSGDKTISLEGEDAEIAYDKESIAINKQETGIKHETEANETPVFNQLIVPQGKRSMLAFAEGSKMWVNAGTRVVYPAVFDKEKREIYVDGEIFLDVAHNGEWPFIVKTKKIQMEVLGTSFNVTAYEKDSVQHVVLVSGSVKVNSGKQETILIPNQMYSHLNNTSQVKTVDVENYVSWKSGIYSYHSEFLGVILQRLSRYYGQEIICSPQAATLKCSGKLDLKDNLQRVLNGISNTVPITYINESGKYRIINK
jgi:hypothetical protein